MEEVILGFLSSGAMTGYDIKQVMSVSTSFFYDASYGSIYPTLKKLEKKGFVTSKEVVEGRKVKVFYSLTDKGRKEFLKWLEKPSAPANTKYEFLAKLFFARHLPKDRLLAMVSRHISEIREVLSKLQMIEKEMKNHADTYQMYTLKFGIDFFTFLATWYENLFEEINAGTEKGEETGDGQ
ncbi:PadR family transcriptional regulator [Kosmotoga olearia]|uniref:Transcriptional regulator, PadR-like family n=1 Tax=Kosmotoga olearia (strain ATCC BAA-1733 / DSM 21960 / TBF 19.5.1) TaxID=521045 RepID=C5CF63_KOSOT|nr:PadR family transcriptional regulator [Kosmotoga olearia]ACR79340.1 transcriptional regulator, PadR-like family [Kosmotoga olearia TBF 19.5.1]